MIILILCSVIGMIIYRNLLVKLSLCFESFLSIIPVIIIIRSYSINGIIIVLYLLWNPTFELISGLIISTAAIILIVVLQLLFLDLYLVSLFIIYRLVFDLLDQIIFTADYSKLIIIIIFQFPCYKYIYIILSYIIN